MPAFIKRTFMLNLNNYLSWSLACLAGSCTLLSLEFKCIEFIVIRTHDWTTYVGALDVTVNKFESTYLSNKISVGAAQRHSGFRISGKFSSVMFHFSRDHVRQLLTSTMTLASSASMATPLSCKTHGHVSQCFNSATIVPNLNEKSTARKFVNIICNKALMLQKRHSQLRRVRSWFSWRSSFGSNSRRTSDPYTGLLFGVCSCFETLWHFLLPVNEK